MFYCMNMLNFVAFRSYDEKNSKNHWKIGRIIDTLFTQIRDMKEI